MKCRACNDSRIFFTVMPDISTEIGWCSHVVSEGRDGKLGLYHYQCGGVEILPVYEMFIELSGGEKVK